MNWPNWKLSICLNIFAFIKIYLIFLNGINASGPWVKNEFKYVIEAGDRECLYQFVDLESVFHTSYQIIDGDDISFEVFDPNGRSLYAEVKKPTGSHQIQHTDLKGDYMICIDNTYSHLKSKMIYLYIIAFKTQYVLKSLEENRALNETAHIAKDVSDNISRNLIEIFSHQAMARFRQTRDEYLIEANNSLVLYWSACQTILIIVCGIFQAYFIKRLFESSGKRSQKP